MPETADIQLTESELERFYSSYFSYYNTLISPQRTIFVGRCLKFIEYKIISGAEGFEVNNKVRAIIAASAVQLTLGLEIWALNYFDTIIIYPKEFDNVPGGHIRFKGETNLKGYIRLSWQSFISGYAIGDDNINLGLHEFTHALRFNPIAGHEQDYFIEHYFEAWMASAIEPFNDIKQNRNTIFRKYGGANINEFLSVCIEHFFESPDEIKEHYPLLYYSTAILLNQHKESGVTEIGVRQKLFEEKNELLKATAEHEMSTKFKRTSTFGMLLVTLVPLVYTAFVTGITSGADLFLVAFAFMVYLRFDFYFISANIKNKRLFLTKGFLLFKNRTKINIPLSQLISLRLNSNEENDAECELIYYNEKETYFYSETIQSDKKPENDFLNELISNKIAVYRG